MDPTIWSVVMPELLYPTPTPSPPSNSAFFPASISNPFTPPLLPFPEPTDLSSPMLKPRSSQPTLILPSSTPIGSSSAAAGSSSAIAAAVSYPITPSPSGSSSSASPFFSSSPPLADSSTPASTTTSVSIASTSSTASTALCPSSTSSLTFPSPSRVISQWATLYRAREVDEDARISMANKFKKMVPVPGSRYHPIDLERYLGIDNNDDDLDKTAGPLGIRDIGYGVKATKDIPRGTVIVQEAPFFRFVEPLDREKMRGCYRVMTDEARIQLLSLTARQGSIATNADVYDIMVAITETNAIPIDYNMDDGDGNGDGDGFKCLAKISGVFPTISYVNHSCAPNSLWRWDMKARQLCLTAIVDIARDSPITASYLHDDEAVVSQAVRQAGLERDFGFKCHCSICTRPAIEVEASDWRFARYRSLIRWFPPEDGDEEEDRNERKMTFNSFYLRRQSLQDLTEAIKILVVERQLNSLSHLYTLLFYLHSVYGREQEAKKAAKLLAKNLETTIGREGAQDAFEFAENPKLWHGWNLINRRRAQKAGGGRRAPRQDPDEEEVTLDLQNATISNTSKVRRIGQVSIDKDDEMRVGRRARRRRIVDDNEDE